MENQTQSEQGITQKPVLKIEVLGENPVETVLSSEQTRSFLLKHTGFDTEYNEWYINNFLSNERDFVFMEPYQGVGTGIPVDSVENDAEARTDCFALIDENTGIQPNTDSEIRLSTTY